MPYYVYALVNPENKIYIGQTDDLEKRVAQHNAPACSLSLHTKRHKGPWRLFHYEEFEIRTEAMKRERALKGGQGREWLREKLGDDLKKGC